MAILRQLDPYNRQLVTLTGPNYRPDDETIRGLWNEVRVQQERIAYRISQGHGYEKHDYEFGRAGNPCSRTEFNGKTLRVLRDPRVLTKQLDRGRTAFYQPSTNTMIIVDTSHRDGGMMYKHDAGINAFNKLD